MPLQKQAIPVNFSKGLDLKTDPKQINLGNFLSLQNTVFNKGGLLQKRNGYAELASLPDASNTFITTFKSNLTALGTSLSAYSSGSETWVNKGSLQPISLSTLSAIRSSTNQTQIDSTVSNNGLTCVVYTDSVPVAGSPTNEYKYAIMDSVTGQNIVEPTLIPSSGGTSDVSGSPRVFFLGVYFVIVFTATISATPELQYIAVNSVTLVQTSPVLISNQYTPATTVAWDGVVVDNQLFLAWNGNDAGGAIRLILLTSQLVLSSSKAVTGHSATVMSVTYDVSAPNTPIVWASFYTTSGSVGYTMAFNQLLNLILAPTEIITALTVNNITSTAQNGVCTVVYEAENVYGYDGSISTNNINTVQITQAGVVGSTVTVVRSVGLASKSFLINTEIYFLAAYNSPYQPSYFLINQSGQVVARLAYSNGGGYLTTGLPSVYVNDSVAQTGYRYADLAVALNKSVGGSNASSIYSQTGLNIVSFDFAGVVPQSVEIGNNLNITGGMLWSYDGYLPVEQGFNVWPDYVEATPSGSGGSMTAQQYYYQVVYSWTDNQGNINRSAPSIPVTVTTTGSTSSVTLNIPSLRLTYKIANPVKIEIYRWSTANQIFYEVTSILNPLLNVPQDYVTYVDTQADSSIIGNTILYTTGGVVEDIPAPATNIVALFNSRLWLVDAEDPNLLWFSKQVIEATPVEMSDLLTFYVAPTTGAQGSTGVITALSAMDDKLIIFKENAIYYINGIGPDNTGANSQYSDPVFITATVGCTNPASIVFMPQGLMFQSDKGIWLLGRDLSTNYIGAAVESLTTGAVVQSAVGVPETNQVRFTLNTGTTLMYDYYYSQWGSFTNVPAVSSTIYQSFHTYINSFGQVFQERVGSYTDGSNPVLIQFTTGWINLAGVQGFQRAYYFYLLGTYLTPHKLSIGIAYDYSSAISQQVVISPTNYSSPWGSDALWGSTPNWGGSGDVEQWRIFLTKQKTQSFQITLKESYDPSLGASAGAGLTITGLNIVAGLKKGYKPVTAAHSAG